MANTNLAGQKGISGYTIKMIAVISMLIDHTAATILERMLTTGDATAFPIVSGNWDLFYDIYMRMREIGRFAFPIYCYMLVEGFYHTRSVPKYALRLFVFALISEVPFDLAIQHTLVDMKYNSNVFFTLLLGLLVIALMRLVEERLKERLPAGVRWLLAALIVAAGALAAEYVFSSDYGASGVLAIVILYLFYQHRLLGFALAVLELVILSSVVEITAFLMLFPMAYYYGTRGRQTKYFFYAVYPVHLVILEGICLCLGLG